MRLELLNGLLEVSEQKKAFSTQKRDHRMHLAVALYRTIAFPVFYLLHEQGTSLLLQNSPLYILLHFSESQDEEHADAGL